jgi:transposase-like protein
MPQDRAVPVMLSAGERRTLKKRARGAKTAYRDWLRAQIVLAAARGRASTRIAADLDVSVDTVRKWRGRFAARGLGGLKDLPRSGRPRRISALERAAVVALACQLPAATGVPLPAGAARSWPPRSPRRGWPARSQPPRCCGSWLSTPSSPGSTNRGSTRATRTSPPRPPSSSTSTRATTRASGYDRIISVDAKPSIQARSHLTQRLRQHRRPVRHAARLR